MINLGQYCAQNTIDGHIHLFDKDGCIQIPQHKSIGFCDIDPKSIELYSNTIPYYDDFINNHYKDNIILLATSTDSKNMIDIHKKYPNIIRGFGELKCYNHFDDVDNDKYYEFKLDRLSRYYELCKYTNDKHLPIFIHYSLYDNKCVEKFTNLINKYPNTIFVLCHCGMDKETDNDFCYHSVLKLMNEHQNLWVDVTWMGLNYFINNPLKLINMDRSRIILGTDMSRKSMNEENYKKEWNKIHNLDSLIKSDRNIKKLFNL